MRASARVSPIVIAIDPEPIRLVYSAPASCPDAAAFFAGVTARARASRVESGDAREFRVTIEETPDGATGTLVIDAAGLREVSGRTCGETAAALALVAAIAIEQRAGEPQEVRPPAPPRSSWHVSAGVGLELELGTMPGTVPAVPVFVTLEHGTRSLRLGATRGLGDDVATGSGNASFRWTLGWLDACPFGTISASWAATACVGAEAGVLEGSASSVGAPMTEQRPWLAPREQFAIAARLGPARIGLEAHVAEPIVRDRFYIAPTTTIHQTPWIVVGYGVAAAFDLR